VLPDVALLPLALALELEPVELDDDELLRMVSG
jgi:hypothetical protein